MARLQILELPEGSNDDRPPFVLVIDQVDEDLAEDIARWPDDLAKRIGARQVLCFPGTIDIPANDTTAYSSAPAAGQEVVVQLAGEAPQGAIDAALRKVKDGPQLARERTGIARDMDRLAAWRDQLADALGTDPGTSWDDLRTTAAEYRTELIRSENAREHLRQERDTQTQAIDRVRNLHRPVEHNGQTICWECSAYDFERQTTDNPPVAHDQCGTLRALDGQREQT
ncbi:hypothetical protein [Streptomyces sp. bgisy022]|uniref:hypothetical protein n=1 Tax=Streptomyces sp. bgisy022 TaxID=3413769 RepID=UPI003D72D5AC